MAKRKLAKTFITGTARGRKKLEKFKKGIDEEPKKKEPIILKAKEKEKTGIAAFREKPTLAGKAVKAITSPVTTVGLAATLATGGAGAIARGAAGLAGRLIGRKATVSVVSQLGKKAPSLVTTRSFVGRSSQSGIDKIFHSVRPVASRFATNTKSKSLSTSMMAKAGMGLGAAGLLVGAIGSYPFAGFIKEEALQTLGFAFNTANQNNDIQGMEEAIANVDEILNSAPSVMDKVPYANVLKQLKAFYEAAETKLNTDKRTLEKKRAEVEAGETAFQRERRESDEAAFERKREFAAEEEERFEGIREETEERKEEEREEESQRFEQIRKEGEERKEAENVEFEERRREGELRQQEERELNARYFDAIRNKDFELADQILNELRQLAERGL